jgi:cell surface protein SprA
MKITNLKLSISFIVILVFASCKKNESINETKDLFVGDWFINQKNIFEPSEHQSISFLSIDTALLPIGKVGVQNPTHQPHEVFFNSKYLTFNSNSVIEASIDELADGQYAFLYKSQLVNLSSVKYFTISCHAEQLGSENTVYDKDVSLLMRLCSDSSINNDYFEIEKPIILAENNSNVLTDLWPDDNFINLDINTFIKVKAERDSQNIDTKFTYTKTIDESKISIKNNPDLTKVNKICIGVKNPGDYTSFNVNDKLSKSVKIWIY